MNSLILTFVFIGMALTAGSVLRMLSKRGVPYSPSLFFLGAFMGHFSSSLGAIGLSFTEVSTIDPRGVLAIFLPVIIFESGFNSDWHIFYKQSGQILVLAFPSVACSAFFLMLSLKLVIGYGDESYTWTGAYMFGAILSCTDTVAVLALLKEIGASRKFRSLIEGESLLNDGSCMVIFTITLKILMGEQASPMSVLLMLLEMTVGGLTLGILFALVTNFILKKAGGSKLVILNTTVCMCYITYFCAEYVDIGLHVSGIMSLVALGIFVGVYGKTLIHADAQETASHFWKYLIYVAETVIFLLAGAIVGTRVIPASASMSLQEFLNLFILYLCMIASRFLGIIVFKGYLFKAGYGLTFKEVIVLTIGGLRGAVGISFALIVAQNDLLSEEMRKMIIFHMAGCALLTLLINSNITGPIIRRLGMCTESDAHLKLHLNFLTRLMRFAEDETAKLRNDNTFLQDADWRTAEKLTGLAPVARTAAALREKFKTDLEMVELSKEGHSHAQMEDLMECRDRILHALKGIIYALYNDSQCSSNALSLLIEACNWDLDTISEPLNSLEYLLTTFDKGRRLKPFYQLKQLPCLGRYFQREIFSLLSLLYDTLETYVNALSEVMSLSESFPVQKEAMEVVFKELSINKELAISFLDLTISKSFPEIQLVINSKKTAERLLERGRREVEKEYKTGQIEKSQSQLVGETLNRIVLELEANPLWNHFEAENHIMIRRTVLSPFEHILKELGSSFEETVFGSGDSILNKEDKAKDVHVLVRGEAVESLFSNDSSYNRRKECGHLLGSYNLLVSNIRYHTNLHA
jgi:NhaP-type Na+/H+ or K+/H+ antiporter